MKIGIMQRLTLVLTLGVATVSLATAQSGKVEPPKSGSSKTEAPKTTEPSKVVEPIKASDAAKVEPAKPCDPVTDASSAKYDLSKGFSSIAAKVVPGVVNVSTTQVLEGKGLDKERIPHFAPGSPFDELFREFFEQMDRPRKVQSLGSGFVIKSDEKTALIVTNYHVIADAKKVSIFLHDNTELEAKVLSNDERTDLALLEVKTDSLPEGKKKLAVLEWGDSSKAKVGDWVLAIGNPFGLGSTVTSGVISNRARDIAMRGGNTRVSEYVDDFIQHDASINMGNSGGPIVDLDGKVIGVNTAIFSPSGGNVGIGFAIPSSVAQDTVKQLLEFGRTKRGWLGVRIQKVTDDIAESIGLGKARGAIVGSVTPEGPAAKAKIEPGDIILDFDGKPVSENRLSRIVGETPVGKSVKVKVWRKGKEIELDVVLGEFEVAAIAEKKAESKDKPDKATDVQVKKVLGLELVPLTPKLREKLKIDKSTAGVVINRVDPISNAAENGIRKEEVILKVGQVEVNTPEDVEKIIDEAKKKGQKNVLLLLSRDGEPRFAPLKISEEEEKDKEKDKSKAEAEKKPS